MIYIKRFLLMMQFLTSIPIPVQLDVDNRDFGKGLVFAPLVGLLIGLIMAGAFYLSSLIFPVHAAIVITILVYIMLTGGLHLDGLGDTFDGLFSNRPKERILEIMRDSRVGTNAVLGIVSVLLLNITLLWGIDKQLLIRVIVLFPVAGRIGSIIGAGTSDYARKGEGLGKSFIDYCGRTEIALGLVIYLAIFFGIKGFYGLMESVIPIAAAFLSTRFFSRKIGGATGDILGAVCELNQTFYLIGIYFVKAIVSIM